MYKLVMLLVIVGVAWWWWTYHVAEVAAKDKVQTVLDGGLGQ